jgi:RNase P/RNase MRP subunit p29
MVKKKLLTLAGVVGILACGACFLPPLPQKKAPLPPALSSVHKIAVQVEDGTAGNLFDSVIMSSATASNFNRILMDYQVRAEAYNTVGHGDAVLRITMLNKTASCVPKGDGEYCSIELIASYTLTAVDGRVLLSRPQESSKNGIWQQGNSLPENLKASTFERLASESLAATAGRLFLSFTNSK